MLLLVRLSLINVLRSFISFFFNQSFFLFSLKCRELERHDRDDDSHGSEGEPGPKEIHRPTLLQRDSFEDRGKNVDNEDRKSDRSGSKNSADWELK